MGVSTYKKIAHTLLIFCVCVVVALPILSVPTILLPKAAQAETLTPRPSPSVAEQQVGTKPAATPVKTEDSYSQFGQFVGYMFLGIGSRITWFGGMFLETSISKLVLEMGTLINSQYIGNTIDSLWTLIRDICNLAFIFGFVYIGIRTIIDSDSSHVKSMLAQIIIGALLINFSLFIAKFIIDASNFVAVAIYNSMTTGEGSISAKFADVMGISSYFSTGSGDTLQKLTGDGAFAFFVMGFIFLAIAGFVLAAGAVLLLVRFVALIFIMIFSPILFAAIVFPGTKEYAHKLWSFLINYALFAPAYLLLLLLSIRILESIRLTMGPGTGNSLGEALNNKLNSFGVVISFFIAIFFLIMSLQIAKKFGMAGADKVTSLAKQGMGAMTVGLAARAGRATLGFAGHKLAENSKLKDAAGRNFFARQALKASRSVGDASFDARNVGGVGKTLGVGDGGKGGFETNLKNTIKKEKEFAASLGHDKDAEKNTEREHNAQIETEKSSATTLKNNLRQATQRDRDALVEATRALHQAQTAEERNNISNTINALNASIQNTTHQHQPAIEASEARVKEMENIKAQAIKDVKGARQKAYAETLEKSLHTRFFYENRQAAAEIRKSAGKEKTDHDKLVEALEKATKGGAAPSAGATPH